MTNKSDYQQVIDVYCDNLRLHLTPEFGEHSIDHICQILQASVDHEYPQAEGPADKRFKVLHDTVSRYMAYKHPDSEIESIEEINFDAVWNVYYRKNGSYCMSHISKATLEDWEQRQNRKSA